MRIFINAPVIYMVMILITSATIIDSVGSSIESLQSVKFTKEVK